MTDGAEIGVFGGSGLSSGSLQPHVKPGEFVVCDQLVNRTYDRAQTYFDGPGANHVSFADPYCDELRAGAVAAGRAEGITLHDQASGPNGMTPPPPLL